MRPSILNVAVLGLISCGGIPLFASELNELHGTWIELIPAPRRVGYAVWIDPAKLVIEKNSMSESVGTSTRRQSLFTLPTQQGSSAIDFVTVVDGEFWTTKGIYKIEGDVLTISESARDADRPKDFRPWESALDQLELVRSFQRAKSTDKNDSPPGSQGSKTK